jgi:UDP-N-acetyl-D-mannosaminuronate dehydrogenase
VLGLTFKENVPDLRNSRVPDIIEELRSFGIDPVVHDPSPTPRRPVVDVKGAVPPDAVPGRTLWSL